jgi:MFS transporter
VSRLRRYYSLRACGSLAENLLQFVIPLIVFQHTGSAVWSGLAFFVEWIPRLLLMPVSGPLVDHFGVRRTYLAAEAIRCGATTLALVALARSGHETVLVAIIGLALVAGAGADLIFIAGEKAVRVLATAEQTSRAQSVCGGIDQATILVAPLLGGLLVAWIGVGAVGFMGVLFLVNLVLAATTADPHTGHTGADTRPPLRARTLTRQLASAARRMWREPILRIVVAVTMGVNLLIGLVLTATPAWVLSRFDRSTAYVSTVFAVAGLTSLAALTLTPLMIRRFGLLRVGAVTALVPCAATALCGTDPGYPVFLCLAVLVLASTTVFTVFIRTVRAKVVPVADFGAVTGVILVFNFLSLPASGLLLAAWTSSSLPLPALYLVVGIGTGLGCLAGLRRLRRLMPQRRRTGGGWLVPALDGDAA